MCWSAARSSSLAPLSRRASSLSAACTRTGWRRWPLPRCTALIPIQWGPGGAQYFYYFHYYAIQANYQAGGKYLNDWHPRIRELLLEKQNPDGSWDVPANTAEAEATVGPNKVYWTAMASLVLDIY